MEVLCRSICSYCNGSGKNGRSNEAAAYMAAEHNVAARRMFSSNILSMSDFQICEECSGDGYIESWESLEEIMKDLRKL
jgi:DnaJ-class molecular chaperone